jgi:hypothetical protein
MIKTVSIILGALALIGSPCTTKAELLSNTSFELNTGSGGTADDWTSSFATVEGWANHSGAWGMAVAPWNNAGTGSAFQEVSATAGTEYEFSLWGQADSSSYTGSFYLTLAWYQDSALLSDNTQVVALTTDWTQYTLGATAPVNANTVQATFGGVDASTVGKFDDASLTAIPEPSSMALLVLSGIALVGVACRRMRN